MSMPQRQPILMNHRNHIYRKGMFCRLLVLIVSLPLLGCSPLYLVNSISMESEKVTLLQQPYGKERRQQLDIFIPEKVVTRSPVVVFFYGGGWKRGQKGSYGFVGHSLSSKGYITVIPDYRLYPEVTFPAFVHDGAKVLAWVYENVEQARNGVVVMGHSAGAHIAAMLALDQRYLEQTGKPASIIRGMIGLAGPYGFNPLEYRSTRPIFAEVDVIESAMPITYACSAKTPLLLFHGVDDRVVIPENSKALKRRVCECAGNADYVELDDIGHFFIVLGLSDSFLANDLIQSSIDLYLQSLSQQSS